MALCIHHCLETIPYTKFAIDIVCMPFNRSYRNNYSMGYFLVGHTSGYTA